MAADETDATEATETELAEMALMTDAEDAELEAMSRSTLSEEKMQRQSAHCLRTTPRWGAGVG
jgi:hypothetical protein